jgi:Na+-driven multidrug efflux pump
MLILPHFFQLNGAWLATPVSDLLAAIVAAITMFIFYRNFKRP